MDAPMPEMDAPMSESPTPTEAVVVIEMPRSKFDEVKTAVQAFASILDAADAKVNADLNVEDPLAGLGEEIDMGRMP
tara:strand:- start:6225 stop:6455 length:231 start_codon:yes stop_codon:yes gene_type:complete